MNGFHTQAGWLAFNAIAIGVVFFSRSSRFFSRQASADAPATRGPNPAAPLLVPLLVIVGAAMMTAAASSGGLDRFYVVRVAIAALVLWKYRRSYSGLGWSWNWVAVGVGIAVFGIWIGLEELLPPEPADAAGDPFLLPALERWMWLVCRVIGAVILVPIAEELAFRGYLLRRLQGAELGEDMKNRWNWVAVLISSVLFGLLHPGRWIAGTLAGVFFAWAFYRRGRLSDAILAHATTNAILAVYVLATKQWGLW
jgi:exosortase E/protease (VPEID-CTERM system)